MSDFHPHHASPYRADHAAGKPAVSFRSAVAADQVEQLRAELSELACELDRRGRPDAADLAASLVIRLGELLGYGARNAEAANAAGS